MLGVKHVAIFVVCLAASAVVVNSVGLGGMTDEPTVGVEGQVNDSLEDLEQQKVDRTKDGEGLIGNTRSALGTLKDIIVMTLLLPQALMSLGLPRIHAWFASAPIYLIVAVSFIEFLRGARMR